MQHTFSSKLYLKCLHAWLTRFTVVVSLHQHVGLAWSARVRGVSTGLLVFLHFCLSVFWSFCLSVFVFLSSCQQVGPAGQPGSKLERRKAPAARERGGEGCGTAAGQRWTLCRFPCSARANVYLAGKRSNRGDSQGWV